MSTSTDRLRKSASKWFAKKRNRGTERTLHLEQLEPRLPLAGFTVTSFQDSGLGQVCAMPSGKQMFRPAPTTSPLPKMAPSSCFGPSRDYG